MLYELHTLRDRGSLLFLLGERREEPLLATTRFNSYRACANYVSICQAKCHFLSLKLNVTSSYFAGTACDNFGAKKLQYVGNSCFFGECVA